MENSVFLAKLLGPYCIIVAVGILFNLKTYQKVMEDFCKNSALIYLGGVIALLFGLLVVLFHNVWVANWAVIITGAWLIILPNTVAKLTEVYQKKVALLVVHLFIVVAIGIFLTVKGY